jgi:hypothetical protein
MKRFALFAVLPWFGALAFCQEPPITEKPAQSPLLYSSSQPSSDFNISQLGLTSPPANSFKAQSCDRPDSNQNQENAKANANVHLCLPCITPNTFTLMAQSKPPSPLSSGQWPGARSIPIPTQWPGAKFEQIPTTWPNLKILRVTEHSEAVAPAK